MTTQTASRIIAGQGILAGMAIVAVVLLAYWQRVDGAAAIATILAVTGVTSGANAAVQTRTTGYIRVQTPPD